MGIRVLLHDYAGYSFPLQLSRKLAARGHEVLHVYSQSVQAPQGSVARRDDDPSALNFAGLRLSSTIDKQAYVQRYLRERAYGRLLSEQIRGFKPDLVLSSNTPLDAQAAALRATHAAGARFVFWLQDIQGIAIERLLGARLNGFGRVVGRYYTAMEKRLLRASDAVVAITEDFIPTLSEWQVGSDAVHVIPNWASMEELPQRPKDNSWARVHGLADRFCFLYSGTIGLKHDPEVLLRLALKYRDAAEVSVVVVSEGAKADWLKQKKSELSLDGLKVLPFQPYADVPDVMGSADVLTAVLDPDASTFSVPSKVLAYHCAGRPILLSVPADNLVARIVHQHRTGHIAQPGDIDAFLAHAENLKSDARIRSEFGANALRYAHQTFDLERITDRFEALFNSVIAQDLAEELEIERTQAI